MSLALRATGSRHQFDIKGLVHTHYYPAIRNPAIRYPARNYPVSIRNPVSGKKPIRYIPIVKYSFMCTQAGGGA